jgi:hypothetical protein
MANASRYQQALHGYKDGHQLLAASVEFTREQQSQLLVMSDLSGPSFRDGFDSYITGYPLASGGYYCFAKTWYAPELPRPGCVWTHTIVISDTDVARIVDFRMLLNYFQRPTNQNFANYRSCIHFTLPPPRPYQFDEKQGEPVLQSLYSPPSKTVLIVSDSSNTYEELTIAILNQQWPRLRRSFRFCTGLLSPREQSFDLAISPPETIRQVIDARKVNVIGPEHFASAARLSGEEWVTAAADDLFANDEASLFRQFLWKYGPDYTDGRSAFRGLCEIYLATSRNSESVEQALSATAHFFPESSSSPRLKRDFFGVNGFYSGIQEGEFAVVQALVTHPASESVPESIASIDSRARELASIDAERAAKIALAASNVGGQRAGQFLDGFVAALGSRPETVPKLSLPLILDLIRRRPRLALSPNIWRRPAKEQIALAAHVVTLSNISELGGAITQAVLLAKAWSALTSLLAQFENEGIVAVLKWLDDTAKASLSIPRPVVNALFEHRHALGDALRDAPAGAPSLGLATIVLDPRSESVRSIGLQPWIRFCTSGTHFVDQNDETRSRAFLLSLGLSVKESGAEILVREAFSTVYESAKENQLNDDVWQFEEPYLPWYFATRNKSARLIRGAVQLFISSGWPAPEFLKTFLTIEQFRRAMEEADRTYSGYRYIQGICDAAKTNVSLTPNHMEVLGSYCKFDSTSNPPTSQ